MTRDVALLPAHRRSLSVVVRSIENSLNDILSRLQEGRTDSSLLHRVETSYSDNERKEILEAVENMRKVLAGLISQFALDKSSVTEAQILNAHCTHIWILLQESRPEKLKRYGEVPGEIQTSLNFAIDELLACVEDIQRISLKHE